MERNTITTKITSVKKDSETIQKTKKYKILLWKAYFDKGYGVTSYIKWFIALIGITGFKTSLTLMLFCLYGFSCLIIGRLWYKFKLIDTEHEVQNIVNPFVREMRQTFK